MNPLGGDFFFEQLGKETDLEMTKSFIFSVEELEKMYATQFNKLKTIISMEAHKYRVFYSQSYVSRPRRASIWASTNKIDFLGSGSNTRWIIIEVDNIDFGYNTIDIDKVWGQAYKLLKEDAVKELTAEEWSKSKLTSTEFKYKSDEAIYIEDLLLASEEHYATATDVCSYLKNYHGIITRPQKMGKALTELGFKQVSKRIKHQPTKVYQVATQNGSSLRENNSVGFEL